MVFLRHDSVQNQLLKTRFEMDGYTPNIVMRSSQIYTTLQFAKNRKIRLLLYTSMMTNLPAPGSSAFPLIACSRKNWNGLEKGKIHQRRYAEIPELYQDVLLGTSADAEEFCAVKVNHQNTKDTTYQ